MTIISAPWAWLLPEGPSRTPLQADADVGVDGSGSPRMVLGAGRRLRWEGQAGEAPWSGFPFIDFDHTPQIMYHIPGSHQRGDGARDYALTWMCDAARGQVTQQRMVMRPQEGAADRTSLLLDRCIHWIVHTFMELTQTIDSDAAESVAPGCVRRTWARVRSTWLQPDPKEPRMELIIQLAQDAKLAEALESIGSHPRRILLRVREQTPIGRVTELDAACIRDYARRPGRTPYEKAGTAQRLLAVQRQASFDTLENRVTCWTLDEMRRRCLLWRQVQGMRVLAGSRAQDVARLARAAAAIRRTEHFTDIAHSSLVHPVMANYPLQMEPRYRMVHQTYQRLLRYEKVIDEAWTWRRSLWSDAARQLIACTMTERLWEPLAGSAPYFRTEAERGRWIAAPSSPGPFATPHGPMYIIDAHDAEMAGPDWYRALPAAWAKHIGMLGADSVCWWPERDSVVLIWSQLWSGDQARLQAHVDDAAIALQEFADGVRYAAKCRASFAGILLSTDPVDAAVGLVSNTRGNRTVLGISLPLDVDTTNIDLFRRMSDDLSVGIDLAVKEVCR